MGLHVFGLDEKNSQLPKCSCQTVNMYAFHRPAMLQTDDSSNLWTCTFLLLGYYPLEYYFTIAPLTLFEILDLPLFEFIYGMSQNIFRFQ